MMPVYAVMMRHANQTWIDSLWIRKFAFQNGAESRQADLKRIHEALKLDTAVWIVEMTLQDGEEAPPAGKRKVVGEHEPDTTSAAPATAGSQARSTVQTRTEGK